jgi:mannose-6-phosphate isomerase
VSGRRDPATEERPWGTFTVLDEDEPCKVKRIVVRPGKRLSYQRHSRRSEHWFIVQGRGVVVLDGTRTEVAAGGAVDIPAGCSHRIENPTSDDIVSVEVQHGDYFGEDDIVRLEDDFGRSGT